MPPRVYYPEGWTQDYYRPQPRGPGTRPAVSESIEQNGERNRDDPARNDERVRVQIHWPLVDRTQVER